MQNNKIFITSIITVFLLCICTRIFYIEQKEGLHIDEALSINNAYNSPIKYPQTFSKNTPYNTEDIQKLYLFAGDNKEDLKQDLRTLYYNNAGYFDHTNLYFMLLRITSFGEQEYNMHNFIKTGTFLNLFFFAASFIIMFLLLRKVFPTQSDKSLIVFTLLISFISTGTISGSLLIRPYQLAQSLFLLSALYYVYMIEKIQKNTSLNITNIIAGVLSAAFCLISCYISTVFLSLLGLSLLIHTIKHKQIYNTLAFIIAGILSVELAIFLYPGYPNLLISKTLSFDAQLFVFNYPLFLAQTFSNIILSYIFYPLVILVLLIALATRIFHLSYKKESFNRLGWTLFIITILWSIVIATQIPYKSLRYLIPVLPLLFLIIPLFLSGLSDKYKNAFMIIISLLYIFYAFSNEKTKSMSSLPASFFSTPQLDNLFQNKKNPFVNFINKNPEIPVIFYKLKYTFDLTGVVPYIEGNRQYIFTNELDFSPYPSTQKIFIITGIRDGLGQLPPDFIINKHIKLDFLQCYLIQKQKLSTDLNR